MNSSDSFWLLDIIDWVSYVAIFVVAFGVMFGLSKYHKTKARINILAPLLVLLALGLSCLLYRLGGTNCVLSGITTCAK